MKRGWRSRRVYEGFARAPDSVFAECLRGVRTATSHSDTARNIRWLAITSSVAGEGKTTLACNLGALYAQEGKRTLVIDADIYTAKLSRRYGGRRSSGGVIQALRNVKSAHEEIVKTTMGFDLLPVAARGSAADGVLSAEPMLALLKVLSRTYDVVVVDLPPLNTTACGLAMSTAFDGIVTVVEWSRTPLDLLGEILRQAAARKGHVARRGHREGRGQPGIRILAICSS